MADKVIYWSKTALTGGAAEALDSIDGTGLQDGEVAHVWVSNVLYIYILDVDSAAAESSPAIIAPATNAGDKRWILQSYYSGSGTLYTDHIAESTAAHGVAIDGLTIKDSGFALGSDADGDMYYRASSALARLEKGAANFKQFMNAAGTAPEWASGIYVGSFTRNMQGASGDVSYTTGFKPSVVLFVGVLAGSSSQFSIGVVYGTTSESAVFAQLGGNSYCDSYAVYANSGTGSQTAVLKSMDATTITLTWTYATTCDPGSIAGYYIAFR